MKTLLASTAVVLAASGAWADGADPGERTTGTIAVDNEGSGMTTSSSASVETVRGASPVTSLSDQTFEGTDTDTADLDDGTVVDTDQTPATATIVDGQVETVIQADQVASGDGSQNDGSSIVTNVEETSLTAGSTLSAPEISRDGYAPLDRSELTTEMMAGVTVYGIAEDNVGEIDALTMDADGNPEGAVISVGGFIGLGETPVAVPLSALTVLRSDDETRVYIDATEEQLEGMPRYDG